MKVKYNMNVVDKGAIRFVFVTRGRAKPFDDIEVEEFFAETDESRFNVEKKNPFRIPNDRNRRVMFMNDLKRGIQFCVDKYGATQEEIIAEANRISPNQVAHG